MSDEPPLHPKNLAPPWRWRQSAPDGRRLWKTKLKINNQVKSTTMNNKKPMKSKPRGRPQVSTLKRLTKSVTVKFSKPDYEMLWHRSKNANRTLAEYIRDAAFDARIVAKHSAEDAAIIRNLTGMANNLNQLTKLSHQTGFYRTKNIVMEVLEKLKSIMSGYKAEERRCRW